MGLLAAGVYSTPALSQPFTPKDDAQILAQLPTGTRHAELAARRLASGRPDVALPLAQFYIGQARASGDLRFLGYAESVLAPWVTGATPAPTALVLQATIQQSRHEFHASLETLDRALSFRPDDAQAWLTRATVLRVMGSYAAAQTACANFARRADANLGQICVQGLRGLQGDLPAAYLSLQATSSQGMLPAEGAWRASELGEMAVRLGNDPAAEGWFREALRLSPMDSYVQAAYADLLLRAGRSDAVLHLLQGEESVEPLLLRLAIAQQQQHDAQLPRSRALLRTAFDAEEQRGEAVHRREQARFLLQLENDPQAALRTALVNWDIQREPDDLLVLVSAARAAGARQKAGPALAFVRAHGLCDARLDALLRSGI